MTKVFIIMYNRLSWPKQMSEFLSDTGCEVILIDNNSTYKPLLDWYDTSCPYKVHRLNENLGHKVFWKSGLHKEYSDQFYVVTDHDLDISNIPHDYINLLHEGFKNNPTVIKSALSLEIDDLPDNIYAKKVYDWEIKWWRNMQDPMGFYRSDADTTFALYDRNREYLEFPDTDRFFSSVRSPRPYVARHLPWYLTKEDINTNEEERYYQLNTTTYWSTIFKEDFNIS